MELLGCSPAAVEPLILSYVARLGQGLKGRQWVEADGVASSKNASSLQKLRQRRTYYRPVSVDGMIYQYIGLTSLLLLINGPLDTVSLLAWNVRGNCYRPTARSSTDVSRAEATEFEPAGLLDHRTNHPADFLYSP